MPDEEEMEAMFNMMFTEMMGLGGSRKGKRGGGFEIPADMFDMMEAMMEDEMDLNDDEDGNDYATMEDIMGAFGVTGRNVFVYGEDDEEYDSDDYDDEDLLGWQEAQFGAALMNEMLSAERRHEVSRRVPGSAKAKKLHATKPSKATAKKSAADKNKATSQLKSTSNSQSYTTNSSNSITGGHSNKSKHNSDGKKSHREVEEEEVDDEDVWETDDSDGDREKAKGKGRKSSKRSNEDDLMTAMMQQMARELGISSAGLKMFADRGYLNPVFGDDEEDVDEEDDLDFDDDGDEMLTAEELIKMEKKREKNRKKKAQQKQNKKLKKNAANSDAAAPPAAVKPPFVKTSSNSKASNYSESSSHSTNGVNNYPSQPSLPTQLPSSSSSHAGRRKSETDVGVENFGTTSTSRHSANGLSMGDKVVVQGRWVLISWVELFLLF